MEFHGFPASSFLNIVLDRHGPATVDQILPLVLPDFLSPFQARTSLSMLDFFVLLDSSSVNPRSSLLFFFAGMCLQEDYLQICRVQHDLTDIERRLLSKTRRTR